MYKIGLGQTIFVYRDSFLCHDTKKAVKRLQNIFFINALYNNKFFVKIDLKNYSINSLMVEFW